VPFGQTSFPLFLIGPATPYDDTGRAVITRASGTVVDQLGPGEPDRVANHRASTTRSLRA